MVIRHAYKQMPGEVTGPLTQLLGWAMWFALALCLAYFIYAAAKLYSQGLGEGSASLVLNLIGAIILSGASGIAAAVLTF